MADWLGITSANYDSHCGEGGGHNLTEALDGTDYWLHDVAETHWFVLNLGAVYNVTKVRGRSSYGYDPIDVNIYISTDGINWNTAVVTGISTWQDTTNWVEINTTPKNGQYVKVEIIDTEATPPYDDYISFGAVFPGPITIFDVYGEVPAGGAEVAVFMGTEL